MPSKPRTSGRKPRTESRSSAGGSAARVAAPSSSSTATPATPRIGWSARKFCTTGSASTSFSSTIGATDAPKGRPPKTDSARDARAIYEDGEGARFPAERLVIFGESLGSAVAVGLAVERPCGGVVARDAVSVHSRHGPPPLSVRPGIPHPHAFRQRRAHRGASTRPSSVLIAEDDEIVPPTRASGSSSSRRRRKTLVRHPGRAPQRHVRRRRRALLAGDRRLSGLAALSRLQRPTGESDPSRPYFLRIRRSSACGRAWTSRPFAPVIVSAATIALTMASSVAWTVGREERIDPVVREHRRARRSPSVRPRSGWRWRTR